MTLTEHLRIPPYAYRLLARNGREPMTVAELMVRSGLSRGVVLRLSAATSWAQVKVSVADRFIMGCGYDPMQTRSAWRYLERLTRSGLYRAVHLRRGRKISLLDKSVRARHFRRVQRILQRRA